MSLWDRLPPEMHEHVLKYAIKESPLKALHKEIKKYYFNPAFNFDTETWPAPRTAGRAGENINIEIRKDQYGCKRAFRKIYYANDGMLMSKYDNFIVDITQQYYPKCYMFIDWHTNKKQQQCPRKTCNK